MFNVVPWLVSIPSSVIGGLLADYLVMKGKPTSSYTILQIEWSEKTFHVAAAT